MHPLSHGRRRSYATERRQGPENLVYSLLDTFDAQILLIYRKGAETAFFYLQHHILEQDSGDDTLFVGNHSPTLRNNFSAT